MGNVPNAKSNGVDIIQLDASVNSSNSGGPLIHPESGDVFGIITRKATGLTDMFDELRVTVVIMLMAYQNEVYRSKVVFLQTCVLGRRINVDILFFRFNLKTCMC